jgi:hypothetical protein
MDSLQSLLKFKRFSSSITGNEFAEKLEAALLQTISDFHSEADRLKTEVDPDKLQERVQQRAQAVLTEMESGPGSLLRQIGRAWATSQGTLARKSGLQLTNDASETVREMWALDRLRETDAGKRLLLLEKAIADGDELTVRAALNAPRAFSVVDDRIAEQIRQLWHERVCPDEAAQYRHLHEAYQCEQANYQSAVDAVKQIAGMNNESMRERLEAQTA